MTGKRPINLLDARCLHQFQRTPTWYIFPLNKRFSDEKYQNWSEARCLQSQRLSYNFVRLVKLPSSSGIVPENWFPSIPLKIWSHYCNSRSSQKGIEVGNSSDTTYRIFRFLKFCNQVGKGPDKLLAESLLREISKLLVNHEDEALEKERTNIEVIYGIEAHSTGIVPER